MAVYSPFLVLNVYLRELLQKKHHFVQWKFIFFKKNEGFSPIFVDFHRKAGLPELIELNYYLNWGLFEGRLYKDLRWAFSILFQKYLS